MTDRKISEIPVGLSRPPNPFDFDKPSDELKTVYRASVDEAATVYMTIRALHVGYQLAFTIGKGSDDIFLSCICHLHSYGHEKGLFEIMPGRGKDSADVTGYLTFTEVLKCVDRWIKKLERK